MASDSIRQKTQREEIAAVEPVADVLESLGVEFYVGVLRVQGEGLDRDDLSTWAGRLEIADVLQRALDEADEKAR